MQEMLQEDEAVPPGAERSDILGYEGGGGEKEGRLCELARSAIARCAGQSATKSHRR